MSGGSTSHHPVTLSRIYLRVFVYLAHEDSVKVDRNHWRLLGSRDGSWEGRSSVTRLLELGGRLLPQDFAERLQGRSVAAALASHQVERPRDTQSGDRQHGQRARGTFRANRQPGHNGEAHAFGDHALDGLGAAQRHELRTIYLQQEGVDPKQPTIVYCRIGARSSHTWFVLTDLLGLRDVRNYDGSWTEYGNLIGAPIEK